MKKQQQLKIQYKQLPTQQNLFVTKSNVSSVRTPHNLETILWLNFPKSKRQSNVSKFLKIFIVFWFSLLFANGMIFLF